MRIFCNYADTSAVTHYRSEGPVRFCKEPCKARGVELIGTSAYDSRDEFDVYYLPRIPTEGFLSEIRLLKARGKRFWWGVDDDYWHIPEWNPAVDTIPKPEYLQELIDNSEKVLCSTEPLMKLVGPKAVLAPNLVDAELFPEIHPRVNDPVRVLWAGSIHHEKDLDQIVPCLDLDLEFLFFGYLPNAVSDYAPIMNTNLGMKVPKKKYGKRVGHIDPVPLKKYWNQLVSINADIGVIPLEENQFNESKSAIKYFEYAMAGICTLASDFGPYKIIRPYNNGCKSSEGYWAEDLQELIDSKVLRERLANNARKYVYDNHSWQTQSKKWEDIFCE